MQGHYYFYSDTWWHQTRVDTFSLLTKIMVVFLTTTVFTTTSFRLIIIFKWRNSTIKLFIISVDHTDTLGPSCIWSKKWWRSGCKKPKKGHTKNNVIFGSYKGCPGTRCTQILEVSTQIFSSERYFLSRNFLLNSFESKMLKSSYIKIIVDLTIGPVVHQI